jgi:hypothetical protein
MPYFDPLLLKIVFHGSAGIFMPFSHQNCLLLNISEKESRMENGVVISSLDKYWKSDTNKIIFILKTFKIIRVYKIEKDYKPSGKINFRLTLIKSV